MGIVWDGSGLWISTFSGGTISKFTTAGVFTGQTFNSGLTYGGGLAYDPRDSTLYVGQYGTVYHYNTGGTQIGSFSTGDDRFVDGLEMELEPAAVPEPLTMLLLGGGLMGLGALRRKFKK